MSTYENNKIPIDKLCKSTSEWILSTEVHEYLRKLAHEFDKKWELDFHKNHWASTKFRTILTVHERIKLTDKLNHKVENNEISQIDITPLRTYLLLTCFDQLGLKRKFLTFNNYLNAKKTKKEICEILDRAKLEPDLEKIKRIHKSYISNYGVKNAFMNFISDILDEKTRDELTNSIRIRINNPKNLIETKTATTQDKLDYLYRIRNNYTHNSFSTGIFCKPLENDNDWTYRESFYLDKWQYSIYTKIDFVEILETSILKGIVNIIKENKYSV